MSKAMFTYQEFFSLYNRAKISEINFYNIDYQKVINSFKALKNYKFLSIGKSFEGKELYLLKIGHGKEKIILWSQMHGNEPISTMALIDLIHLINIYSNLKKIQQILNQCQLYFIPMVNPDGAERFTRRNMQGIDINRDALRLGSPEAKALWNTIMKIKPDFAFNLHDQEIYYGTKNSIYPTTMAFLSPSYDEKKSIGFYRRRSMQVLNILIREIKKNLSCTLAKYDDSYMPTAFGDNIQKQGISTMLFEGGYILGDKNREKIRAYYTYSLLTSLSIISTKIYENQGIILYKDLPYNIRDIFFDLLIKNITIKKKESNYIVDIGVRQEKINDEDFSKQGARYLIADIGDLRNYRGFSQYDCGSVVLKDDKNLVQKYKEASFLFDIIVKCRKIK